MFGVPGSASLLDNAYVNKTHKHPSWTDTGRLSRMLQVSSQGSKLQRCENENLVKIYSINLDQTLGALIPCGSS